MRYVFKCEAFIEHPSACSYSQRNGTLLCCHSCPKYETCAERCNNMVHKCRKSLVEKARVRNASPGKLGRSGRKVVQYDLEGNKLAVYSSMKEAGAAVGVGPACICLACRGQTKTAGGFRWQYEDESEEE